jgi:folate-binding protein YgfZ
MTPTEIAATSAPALTPLAGLIAPQMGAQELSVYRGVFTPRQFDVPDAETAALASSAALHDLGWMRRIEVRGEDRVRWLSGMVTNMVNDLASNAGAWNLVLNAQGRIQGDLWVWRDGDRLELEIAADQFDKLLAHLNRFIIMDDVELVPLEGETALGLTGPLADGLLTHLGLPPVQDALTQTKSSWGDGAILVRKGFGVLAPHYELWGPAAALAPLWQALREAGATQAGTAALDAFRIAEGIPVYGIDIAERDLPQETSQTRALHFNKGCYLGQEIVERIRSRGNVHRHLRHLELDGPVAVPGTELFVRTEGTAQSGSAASGQITSSAALRLGAETRVFALAMVRAEAELPGQALTYMTESATGTAGILASPPALNPQGTGKTPL